MLPIIAFTKISGKSWASKVALVVKNQPVNAGNVSDLDSILGSGRSPGGGNGSPLQCSCLENPVDRGTWWATDHGDPQNRTQLKRLSMYTCIVNVHLIVCFL